MYKHHEESIENMKEHFRKHGAIALILVGSVVKGKERADSDLDGVVILSEEEYAEKEKSNTTTETIDGLCTYEGGYFDIKYVTKPYLKDLAEKGSEPARNGFSKAKILFCNDAEIENILPRIPIFQKKEKEEKLLSFYSNFWLNYYYFLKSCSIDGYMKMHTISEIIYSIYRMILQENEILFDCNRRLEQQVEAISEKTVELVSLGRKLEVSQNIQDADSFVDKFLEITAYVPPKDLAVVLTRYSKDFQEWWREPRPNIQEW
ncbi:MAG: nucleotidyltransferase domain-containing protein [Roseburia sp.]|nr:nucleotidyltransferase domain-containing protein [Roseburia sp.]